MNVVPLETVLASLESGARPPGGASVDSGEIPSLGGEHLNADGGFDFLSLKRIPRPFFESIRGGRIESRDILVVKDGATTGKTSFVGEDFPFHEAAVNEHVFCVRVDQSKACPEYVFYFLRSPQGQRAIALDFRGATVGGISRDFARKVRLPLPPFPEQRRIAQLLDKANALRAKRRAALAMLDTLTQSIFLDMFGDPISNPRKWPQQTLETFFHFTTGKLDSNAAVASGQYPFFTCSREDAWIDKFAFDCEALLLAGNNATADYSVKYYKGKFNAYQRTYVITLRDERNSYEYSRFVLEHRLAELKRISKGTGTKYLTLELLNRIRVPVPPQELQGEFARRVRALENPRIAQRTALAELDGLFSCLQYRAFRGEL